jgi:carboxylesterase type B
MPVTHEPLGTLPPQARKVFAEIGPVWGQDINKHRDFVIAAYSPIVAAADNSGIRVEREIAYGPHPRQVLDVFVPSSGAGTSAPRDVVIFVHGGAFIRGKKSTNGHIYDNVCYWFAGRGYVAINAEYRLAPEAPYPGGGQDVANAVDWAAANAGRFGGSAARIFLIGHSAGGTHVATCLFDPEFPGRPAASVAGAVLLSARLRADVLAANPNAQGVRAYFGSDESLYESRSPVTHAHCSQVPLMIAIAQFENPYLDLYGAEFFHRACAARARAPRFVQMRKHNHTSIVAHFNSGEEYLGCEIADFFDNIPS